MKLHGKKLQEPNIETVVLPRGNGDLVFKCQAILSFDDFDKLCPRPDPPSMVVKGGRVVKNVEDSVYKGEIDQYGNSRMAWMIITSLRATETLEWDTVKFEDSSTWQNYKSEMQQAGLCDMEINRIISGVMDANALNEDRVKEARERFFTAGQLQPQTPTTQTDGQNSTASGEPANDSTSNPQDSQTAGTTVTS